jgi:hypothetical protein
LFFYQVIGQTNVVVRVLDALYRLEEEKKKNYTKKMQTDPNGATNGYGEKRGKTPFCAVTVP